MITAMQTIAPHRIIYIYYIPIYTNTLLQGDIKVAIISPNPIKLLKHREDPNQHHQIQRCGTGAGQAFTVATLQFFKGGFDGL